MQADRSDRTCPGIYRPAVAIWSLSQHPYTPSGVLLFNADWPILVNETLTQGEHGVKSAEDGEKPAFFLHAPLPS